MSGPPVDWQTETSQCSEHHCTNGIGPAALWTGCETRSLPIYQGCPGEATQISEGPGKFPICKIGTVSCSCGGPHGLGHGAELRGLCRLGHREGQGVMTSLVASTSSQRRPSLPQAGCSSSVSQQHQVPWYKFRTGLHSNHGGRDPRTLQGVSHVHGPLYPEHQGSPKGQVRPGRALTSMQAPLRTFPWEGRWQLTDINNVNFSLCIFSTVSYGNVSVLCLSTSSKLRFIVMSSLAKLCTL